MGRCRVDPSVKRVVMEGFDFPLGCYPVEPVAPIEGYTLHFEPADGGHDQREEDDAPEAIAEFDAGAPEPDEDDEDAADDPRDRPRGGPPADRASARDAGEGEWEEWPDRYVYDVLIKASRIESFLRTLFSLLPGRVFPILDVLGNDAYREIDPYVAYEMVGTEQFLDAVRRFKGYLLEDGFVGFGVMSEEPFYYIFVDEHKMVTIRAEAAMKEKVERVLQAYDLKPVEQLAGADSAVHEHRGVLEAPPDRPDLLTSEEIVEELRDVWGLELNVDPHRNLDDRGRELGITGWRCVVRRIGPDGMVQYLEVCLSAANLMEAHDLALFAAEQEAEEPTDQPEAPAAKKARAKPPRLGASPTTPGPGRPGRRTNEPEDDEGDEGDSEALTTVDVIAMDRLAPEQLEELAKEMGFKSGKATTKQSRVWGWRKGD